MKKTRIIAALAAGVLTCAAPVQVSAIIGDTIDLGDTDTEQLRQKVETLMADYMGTDDIIPVPFEDITTVPFEADNYNGAYFVSRQCAYGAGMTPDHSQLGISPVELHTATRFYVWCDSDSLTIEDFPGISCAIFQTGDKENQTWDEGYWYSIRYDQNYDEELSAVLKPGEVPGYAWIYDTYIILNKMLEEGKLNMLRFSGLMPADSGDTISILSGDLNNDGASDVKDAVLLSRVVAEDPELTLSAAGRINADLDDDGAYTVDDLTLLLAKISGK